MFVLLSELPWMEWGTRNPITFYVLFLTALLGFMALLTAVLERMGR